MIEFYDWKIEIRKVENGYILKGKFGDSTVVSERLVEEQFEDQYSQSDLRGSNLTAMSKVLWEIMEYFDVHPSDHNKNNLRVLIEENSNG